MENGNNTSAQAEVLLSIRSISKSFDGTLAVDNVNLDIHKGEIFALLGGSGSGKSTLLRMLAGFETPNAGSIMLDGQDVTALPPFLRPTNMMFQSYALFPHMTVEQNIAMGLKQDKLPKSEIRDRVAAMLKLVKMEPYARRKPQQLSGGQQQRVALARSLAKRPKLLLLDEPMGALDKKLRTEMQLELVEILENVGGILGNIGEVIPQAFSRRSAGLGRRLRKRRDPAARALPNMLGNAGEYWEHERKPVGCSHAFILVVADREPGENCDCEDTEDDASNL